MTWHQSFEAIADERTRSWDHAVAHRRLLAQLPRRVSAWQSWSMRGNSLVRALLALMALMLIAGEHVD